MKTQGHTAWAQQARTYCLSSLSLGEGEGDDVVVWKQERSCVVVDRVQGQRFQVEVGDKYIRRHGPMLHRVEGEIEVELVHCVHWMSKKRCSCSLDGSLEIECMLSISRYFAIAQKEADIALSITTLNIHNDTAENVQLLQSKSPSNSRFMEFQPAENATYALARYTISDGIDRMGLRCTGSVLELIGDGVS